jgi:hypothetical protein
MNIQSYCGYCDNRKATKINCPVIQDGIGHIHTECRACKYNPFDFYTTLKAIRIKMSDIDPVWNGIYPKFDEYFFKYQGLGVYES